MINGRLLCDTLTSAKVRSSICNECASILTVGHLLVSLARAQELIRSRTYTLSELAYTQLKSETPSGLIAVCRVGLW